MNRNYSQSAVRFVLFGTLLLYGCTTSTSSSSGPTGIAPGKQSGAVQVKPSSQGTQQSAGVVQNVRGAAKRTADMEDLKNLALAYFQFASGNDSNRGPSSVQDIKDSLPPKMIEALKDESVYVVIWKIRNPSGETVIAYAAEPDVYGTRLVAKGDGSVTRMNKDDFERVKPKR